MLGRPHRGGLGPAERTRRNWPRSRNSRRPLERRRWLGCSRNSWQPGWKQARDSPRCVDTMRRCALLRISGELGLSFINYTSALRRLRLRWASSPTFPLRVCASLWRELSCNLVCCLWPVWQSFVGFFGSGLVKSLVYVWWMCHYLSRCCSGIPKLVRRGGNLNRSRHGRMVSERPCCGGRRPNVCERATRVFAHLVVWAPNMYPDEAEPLPPAAFHPPVWPTDLSDPPPPIWDRWRGGGGRSSGKSGAASSARGAPPLHPPCALHPPDPRENLATLLSTPVKVPGPMRGGGIGRVRSGGVRHAFALGVRTRPPASRSKFQGRRQEGGSTGTRPAKRPVLGFQAGGGSAGDVGITVRL